MIDASSLQMLLITVTGWLDDRERKVLAYLIEENRVLRRQVGRRRLRLTDQDRRKLAARAYRVGLWSAKTSDVCEVGSCGHRLEAIIEMQAAEHRLGDDPLAIADAVAAARWRTPIGVRTGDASDYARRAVAPDRLASTPNRCEA